MIVNEETNFTPNDSDNCRPTSGLTCEYCFQRAICNNVMKRDDIYGVRSDRYIGDK